MKFTIVGSGYVGLSLSALLSSRYSVISLDIDEKKVNSINSRISPINDSEIESLFEKNKINLFATSDKSYAYKNSDFIIVAVPTNYDISTGAFDTSNVESVICDALRYNKNATIIIKSTVPLGFTEKISKFHNSDNILFSPEFLREGKALLDNYYPSRIVIGSKSKKAHTFAETLLECSMKTKETLKIYYMSPKEAEAVKLFSNTYLAMRIAFFNELDTFAESENISSQQVIAGVSGDLRIGDYYNNPSFGYGGYCLPKDTKQLLDNYNDVPNNLIKAIIDSNQTRKEFIANSIIKKKVKVIGVYRLAMKMDSDNFRDSAVLDIIRLLQSEGIEVNLYEPNIGNYDIGNIKLINNLKLFIQNSDLIIANRITEEIMLAKDKIYSRDIFQEN
tara:strand:- start:553 stop:1725 length:1173 start_codon:yes stop_codon:yes gene_type:complete